MGGMTVPEKTTHPAVRGRKVKPVPAEVPEPALPPKPTYRGQLSFGDYHANVRWAKQRLGVQPESQSFDRALREAVSRFQEGLGWRPSGRLDKGTWAAL